jgi:hypothetical protein
MLPLRAPQRKRARSAMAKEVAKPNRRMEKKLPRIPASMVGRRP